MLTFIINHVPKTKTVVLKHADARSLRMIPDWTRSADAAGSGLMLCVCVLQSGAGELDPRRSRESDLQGAPASLLSGEGGFQQGQSFTQTHGAGERTQHQAVDPSLLTSQRHLNASTTTATLRCPREENGSRELALAFPATDCLLLFVCFCFSFPLFYFFILILR